MSTQTIQRIGLDTLPVTFVDTSDTSPNYFDIVYLPPRFTAGKNLIKIKGNSTTLLSKADVFVEVLDAINNPLYFEVLDYQDDDGTVCVQVLVQENTAPGNCTIYIATRAINIPELGLYNIPPAPGSNIKWKRILAISPATLNSNELVFVSGSLPKIDIKESINPYFGQSYKQDRLMEVSSSSTIKLIAPGTTKKSAKRVGTSTGQNRIGPNYLYKVIQPNPIIAASRGNAVSTLPIVIENNTLPTIQITSGNFIFSSSMVGGTVTVNNPIIDTAQGLIAADTSYTSIIVNVLNDTTAQVVDDLQFVYNGRGIKEFSSTPFTCSYVDSPIYTPSENYQSYIDVDIHNIRPATGDVYKIRTYMRPVGSAGEYRMINETVLSQQDILVDTGSLSGENKIGEFESLADITSYWSSSLVGPDNLFPIYDSNYNRKATDLKVTYSRNILNDAMQLDSLASYTQGDFAVIKLRDSYFPKFYKDDKYVVALNASVNADSIFQTNQVPTTQTKLPNGWVDVYVSGSAFDSNVTLTADNIQTTALGKYLGSVYINDGALILDKAFSFQADQYGTGTVLFAVRSGNVYLSNIHVYPETTAGQSPTRIRLQLPVPTISINAEQQFKFQYFDYQGNPADYETEVFGPVFAGGNTYIEGDQNVLTGSLSVGGGIGRGLDIVGDVDYGWLGLHGYDGFDNAVSGTGAPGVTTWSGSTTVGSTTYVGIGFELASDNAWLKFKAGAGQTSSLDIKANTITVDNLIVSGGIAGFTSSYWTGSSDGSIKRVSNVVITGSTYISGALSIGDRIAVASASRDLNLLGTNAVIRVVRVDPTLANSPSIEFMPKQHIDSASSGYWDVSVRQADGSFRIRDRAVSTSADKFILSGSQAWLTGSMLDIVTDNNSGSLRLTRFTADSTNKTGRIVGRQYLNSEIDFIALDIRGLSGNNELYYGGGSAVLNTATSHVFWTAPVTNQRNGTASLSISSSGYVGIGTGINPITSASLQVNGNVFATSFTGSLFGTSSWAQNAITASFSETASYVNPLQQNVIVTGSLTFASSSTGTVWSMNTDGASIKFYNTGDGDTDSRLEFQTLDNNNEYFRWTHNSAGTTYESMRIVPNGTNNATMTLSGSMITTGNIGVGIGAFGSLTAKVNISASGNGAELLRFVTERPWRFLQTGSGITSTLELNSLSADKDFIVTSFNRSSSLEVRVSDTAGSEAVRLIPNCPTAEVTIGHRSAESGMTLDVTGSTRLRGEVRVGDLSSNFAAVEIGVGRTAAGYAYLDLVGDTTYTDYGFRIIRNNTGADATTVLAHRGTGSLSIATQNTASMQFITQDNSVRMFISSSGNVGIGTTTPSSKLHVSGSVQVGTQVTASGRDSYVGGQECYAAGAVSFIHSYRSVISSSVNQEYREYNAILGGAGNIISGGNSSVILGGSDNTVGSYAATLNGSNHTNTGAGTTIGGQYLTTGTNNTSPVLINGQYNTISSSVSTYYNTLIGGEYCTIFNNNHGFIAGGRYNILSSSGTTANLLGNSNAIIGGISGSIVSGTGSVILGGKNNIINGHSYAAIMAGELNTIHYDPANIGREAIVASYSSSISNTNTTAIIAGYQNKISGSGIEFGQQSSFLGGGSNNTILNTGFGDAIIGGSSNNIQDPIDGGQTYNNTILGGTSNTIYESYYNSIIGGNLNVITGSQRSAIVGGQNNKIAYGVSDSIVLGGSYITASANKTVYTPNLIVTGSLTVGSSSMGPNENTLTLGARDTVNEGGQIGFNAPGGTYTSASMIDNYQNQFRILKGTNASSTAAHVILNLHNGNFGLSVTPAYQLHLSTDSAGKPSTNTWTISSDIRLKENIEEANYDTCYDIIKNLPLKRYTWKQDVYTEQQVADRSKLGWIAQDVQTVFPKAVTVNSFSGSGDFHLDDCLSMNADQIYAAMYGTIKKLITENELLKSELQTIKTHLGL